jgi:hypothetical protein
LFAADGNVYTWSDVLRLARLRGVWSDLVDNARAGEAAAAWLDARGTPIDDEVDEAARAFRYRHDLLASEELVDWLRRRGLTSEDWYGFLRRQVAARLVDPPGEGGNVDGEDAAWADGICSGHLGRLALELAEMVAVSPGTPLELLDDAFDAFCDRVAEQAPIAHEVETNRLEWARVAYAALSLPSDSAAHEAAQLLRTDGEPIADVAARAGVTVEDSRAWLDEVEPELATRFLSADVGDVVGPVALEDRFVVATLRAKTPPSTEDDAVRDRARHAVVARTVARAVNDRVTWLERP